MSSSFPKSSVRIAYKEEAEAKEKSALQLAGPVSCSHELHAKDGREPPGLDAQRLVDIITCPHELRAGGTAPRVFERRESSHELLFNHVDETEFAQITYGFP